MPHRRFRHLPEHEKEPMLQDIDDQILAEKATAILMALRGSQGVLDRYFALRNACDGECWRKVLTALVQAELETPISRSGKTGDNIVDRSN